MLTPTNEMPAADGTLAADSNYPMPEHESTSAHGVTYAFSGQVTSDKAFNVQPWWRTLPALEYAHSALFETLNQDAKDLEENVASADHEQEGDTDVDEDEALDRTIPHCNCQSEERSATPEDYSRLVGLLERYLGVTADPTGSYEVQGAEGDHLRLIELLQEYSDSSRAHSIPNFMRAEADTSSDEETPAPPPPPLPQGPEPPRMGYQWVQRRLQELRLEREELRRNANSGDHLQQGGEY